MTAQPETMAEPAQPLSGRFGRYEIVRLLGRGGMGAVYLARQVELERPVVIKVIARELASDPSIVERLKREAKAAAQLSSDNVVQVYEWGIENGVPYIAMEFVDGESLASLVEKRGRLPAAEATAIVLAAARGLRAAHEKGVLHRDVKPANILVARDGRVKVADFGLAKFENGAPPTATPGAPSTLSLPGMVLGTPDYMAPEQADGSPLDARCDIYALGVSYFELLTGKRPFRGTTPLHTIKLALTAKVPTPRELVPDLSPTVEQACLALMAREPERRPQTMAAAIELLERLATVAPGSAPVARVTPVASAPTVALVSTPPPATPLAATQPFANSVLSPAPAAPTVDVPVARKVAPAPAASVRPVSPAPFRPAPPTPPTPPTPPAAPRRGSWIFYAIGALVVVSVLGKLRPRATFHASASPDASASPGDEEPDEDASPSPWPTRSMPLSGSATAREKEAQEALLRALAIEDGPTRLVALGNVIEKYPLTDAARSAQIELDKTARKGPHPPPRPSRRPR